MAKVAERSEYTLKDDMEVEWNIIKGAEEKGQKMTKKMLAKECAYIKADEWSRFDKAFNALKEQGAIREVTKEVGKGFFGPKKETVLEAVKPPEKVEEPSMKKDIKELKEHSGHASLTDED